MLLRLSATLALVANTFAHSHDADLRVGKIATYDEDGGKASGPTRKASIAIATTILNPGPQIVQWMDYHLHQVGVQHVLIYMDDPSERLLFSQLCADRPVTLLGGSQIEQKMSPESRLILRQEQNMKHAISHLFKHGYDWLLHIDIDELLYEPSAAAASWSEKPEVGSVHFTNHEALPLSHHTDNPFEDCVWFRLNTVEQRPHYMAYGNGKSAVRLTRGVIPQGPHDFSGFKGERLAPSGNGDEPVLLHYPTPSFQTWVEKFTRYGDFSDYWFGDRRVPNRVQFMLRSRDLVQEAHKTGDWSRARTFFDQQILADVNERREAINKGHVRYYAPFAEREGGYAPFAAGLGGIQETLLYSGENLDAVGMQ
ncbi:Uu.00g047590.m01.CDS01 [Anthostomella pinea]|uniref:Uu.00g047590.m01.CDS01 n=1 Tax=Anthostomella pinea TaxID=933095 RepID=A0AAI8VBL0_9PEZI|nr:Uu.00g047590.m01.CDS01 [Anthostomella pinea]